MLKIFRKAVLLFAVMVMTANSVCAYDLPVPQDLSAYGDRIYSEARTYFGRRSFSGYCGTYVKCQLRAMGIFKDGFDLNGNGNQWYSNFDGLYQTSGGYYVYRESGSDCIEKLTEKFGTNLRNIVLSFPIQSGYSARYPGAGHALVLYELRDGIAYYSESFRLGGHREGEVVAEEIGDLLDRYASRHGRITGCVLLSEERLNAFSDGEHERLVVAQFKEMIETLSSIDFIASEFVQISQTRVVA